MRLFDVLGPVMTGPSSSHTAGAVRIGSTARRLLGEQPAEAEILLYGSFAAGLASSPGLITEGVVNIAVYFAAAAVLEKAHIRQLIQAG